VGGGGGGGGGYSSPPYSESNLPSNHNHDEGERKINARRNERVAGGKGDFFRWRLNKKK